MNTLRVRKLWNDIAPDVVLRGAGGILVAAAIAKAYSLITDPSNPGGADLKTILLVLVELGAGLWLVGGVYARTARWVAFTIFTTFACLSLYRALNGEADCGCFGSMRVKPWYVFVLDAGIALLLIRHKPRRSDIKHPMLRLVILMSMLTVAVVPLGYIMVVTVPVQNTTATIDEQNSPLTLGNERINLTVRAQVFDLGYLQPGSVSPVAIELHNPTKKAIKILETNAQCACTVVTGVPDEVDSATTAELYFTFSAPDKVMHYSKKITLTVDGAGDGYTDIIIRARLGLPLMFKPEVLLLDSPKDDEMTNLILTVHNDGKDPVHMLYATCTIPGLFASVPREPILPHNKARIMVSINPDIYVGDMSDGTINLHTSSDNQRVLVVPVKIQTSKKNG